MLYEHFNTTNQTQPHFERHQDFVNDITDNVCGMIMTYPHEERCAYAVAQCDDESGMLINYYYVLYCHLNTNTDFSMYLGMVLLIIMVLWYFTILGTTADVFFCPALSVLSKLLGMSENVAGVTLLAFGNGAADLFSAMSSLGKGGEDDSNALYSDLYGAGIFVTTSVAGIIVVCVPFVVVPHSFLRDTLFLLLGVTYADYAIKTDRGVNLTEAFCVLSIYIFYITSVFVDQFLVNLVARKLRSGQTSAAEMNRLKELQDDAPVEIRRRSSLGVIDFYEHLSKSNMENPPNHNLLQQFIESLNPIGPDEWEESGTIGRLLTLIKAPITMALRLVLPIVDYEADNHGWSKLLNCIQIVTVPLFVIRVMPDMWDKEFGKVPLPIVIVIIFAPISMFVFSISRTDSAPNYHDLISIFAVVGSVFLIYLTASEVIGILDVLGTISYRSSQFIGCTLLAWGNSIGDLVSNVALARQGYYKMGYAACFGGPIFNSLTAISMTFIYQNLNSPDHQPLHVGEGTLGENCGIFMIIVLILLITAASLTNFVLRRSVGLFTLICYLLFIVYALLGEFEIVHTYGTDHNADKRIDSEPDATD